MNPFKKEEKKSDPYIERIKSEIAEKDKDNSLRYNDIETKKQLPSFEEDLESTKNYIKQRENKRIREGRKPSIYPPD